MTFQLGKKGIIIVFVLLAAITLSFRALPLINGFVGSESMVAFAAMNFTVQNNYILPQNITNLTSSPPYQFRFTEAPFLVYAVTVPYHYLHPLLTILEIAYLIKSLFIILSILIIIFFCKRITGGYKAGMLAVGLFAVFPTANFIQGFLEWNGDFFLPILLLASIICLILARESWERTNWHLSSTALFSCLSIILLIGATISWRGGEFALVSYAAVLLFIILNSILKNTRKAFGIVFTIGVVAWFFFARTDIQNTGSILIVLTQQMYSNLNVSILANAYKDIATIVIALIGFTIAGALVFLGAIEFFKKKNIELFGIILLLMVIAIPVALQDSRFASLMVIEVAIIGGIMLSLINSKRLLLGFCILIALCGVTTVMQIITTQALFYSSPSYHSAMQWIESNTPANSLFITDYLDSAAIQYWGNRSVYGTSWWNDNISSFPDFLYTTPCNATYLIKSMANYMVINKFWCTSNASSTTPCETLLVQYNLNTSPTSTTFDQLEYGNVTACGSLQLNLTYQNNQTRIYRIEDG